MKDTGLTEGLDFLDGDTLKAITGDAPVVDVINIGLDEIDVESETSASDFVKTLRCAYYDEDFLRENPAFKRQLDTEVESLRILFKMRKADERTHDALIHAIEQTPSNASLYKSLTDMQRTILSISERIDACKQNLITLLKNYQLEINFKDTDAPTTDGSPKTEGAFRGSKEFIEAMKSSIVSQEND